MSLRSAGWRLTPVVLVLLAAVVLAMHRSDLLPTERARSALTDLATPVLAVATAPFSQAAESMSGVQSLRHLKSENLRLTEENLRLQEWYEQALRLQAENKSLRELLNVKPDPEMRFVTTRVVSDPGGSFVKSVLLPAGETDGIVKGGIVMSGHGLIGRVMEVGRHSARVLLITDLNSRIPVTVQNTRTRAILAGKNKSLLRLERLPIDSGLTLGQRIVTSDDGGYLPPDVPIGTIVAIGKDGVLVKPLADIDRLNHVVVVTVNVAPEQLLSTGSAKEAHVATP
jgi:rod shape-determining protein MreC